MIKKYTALVASVAILFPLLDQANAALSEPERHLIKTSLTQPNHFNDRFEAEVWLTDMSLRLKKRIRSHHDRIKLLNIVHTEAHKADLEPELVLAVIDVESSFNRWAISPVGARGLMQIMPFWQKEIGKPDDNLFHLQTNIRMGCKILRHYIDIEKGNIAKGLARYNGSRKSNRYPLKVMSALRDNWYRP